MAMAVVATPRQILGFVLGVAFLLGAFSAAHKHGVFGNNGKNKEGSGAAAAGGIEAAGAGARGSGGNNSNAYMYCPQYSSIISYTLKSVREIIIFFQIES